MSANNNTPNAERLHIGFFGKCNSGKSSLINALTGQMVAIVSDVAGTTTDPVSKAMELPGVGAAVLIDTAGLDDVSSLGEKRSQQTLKVLDKTDVAVVLFSGNDFSLEAKLCATLRQRGVSVVGVLSKSDTFGEISAVENAIFTVAGLKPISLSAETGEGIDKLRIAIADCAERDVRLITEGFCEAGDTVVLVMPQDSQAPQGRLIKPQAQVLRELLDRGCVALCCTAEGLPKALGSLASPPKLIITDSQVFAAVYPLKPKESLLTSFSILFAHYKGDIRQFVEGASVLDRLTEASQVLIAEACTHAPAHEDIGRVKLPRMLRRHIGEGLRIDIVGGNDFPNDLSGYDLIIHCGACMFNRRHVMSRIAKANAWGVPITNYGVAIAALTGILPKICC